MIENKKIILSRVNELIEIRKKELLEKLPDVHEVDDGVIIRSFSEWDSCDTDDRIKYKRLINKSESDEKIVMFYLPKGAYITLEKRDYIKTITCINGELELNFDGTTLYLTKDSKVVLDSQTFQGKALKNTYVITNSH